MKDSFAFEKLPDLGATHAQVQHYRSVPLAELMTYHSLRTRAMVLHGLSNPIAKKRYATAMRDAAMQLERVERLKDENDRGRDHEP
jgi:hypothetical protein